MFAYFRLMILCHKVYVHIRDIFRQLLLIINQQCITQNFPLDATYAAEENSVFHLKVQII